MPDRRDDVTDASRAGATTAEPPATTGRALVPLRPRVRAEALDDPRRSDVDEWGRSERVRAFARQVYEPIYRNWFRAEWEGLEKIPASGGALLVANHAAAIPSDAPVIMHGIEKELQRPVYGLADHLFKALPVVGTMWSRVGGVAAHPDNAYRLLREQQQLVLVFPEGTKGTGKTYDERYRLRRFGRGGFVEIAMRAGVPIIPIAVVGAEESMPILFKIPAVAKALRPPVLPGHRQHAAVRPVLGSVAYFPAKFKLRVLDPVYFDVPPDQERYSKQPDHGRGRGHPGEAPGGALRHAAPAASRSGSADGTPRPHHRPRHVLGRPGRPGPRARPRRRDDRRPRHRRAAGRSSSAPSTSGPTRTTRSSSRIVRATQVDTILHTFLVVDSTRMSGRQLHEINVIGTMNLLAAAGAPDSSGAHVVVKSSALVYGSHAPRPDVVPRGRRAARTRRRTRVERSLLEVEGYVRDFADDNPHVAVTLLRFSNVLGPDIDHAAHEGAPAARRRRRSSASTRASSSSTRTTSCGRSLFVLRARGARHLQRRRRRHAAVERGRRHLRQAGSSRCRRSAPRLAAGPARRLGLVDLPPELLEPAPLRPRRRQPPAQGAPASATATRRPAPSRASSRPAACAAPSATDAGYRYERDVENFFRHSPAVVRDEEPPMTRAHPGRGRHRPQVGVAHPRRARRGATPDPADGARDRRRPSTRSRPTADVGALVVTGAGPPSAPAPTSAHLGGRAEARAARHLRGLPPHRPLAAADHRRGQRRRRRRRHEPGAVLRRAPGRPPGPLRHPVPAARHPPRRRPHLDAAAHRRPAGGRGHGALRRGARRRRPPSGRPGAGAASRTTSSCSSGDRPGRRRRLGAPGAGRPGQGRPSPPSPPSTTTRRRSTWSSRRSCGRSTSPRSRNGWPPSRRRSAPSGRSSFPTCRRPSASSPLS